MSTPLRIVFLDSWKRDTAEGSGTTVGISNLAEALRLLGHEVSLVQPSSTNVSLGARIAFNLRLPGSLRGGAPSDLVVGFDLDGFYWASVRERRIPYVVCLKGIAADEARFSRSWAERLYLSALAHLERRNADQADRVVLPSRYSAGIAAERYNLPTERLRVVPEAVDLRGWKGRRSGSAPSSTRKDSPPTILSVARQYPRKDTETLLRAMPEVSARHPAVSLVVVGDGPELLRLRAISRELGLESTVRFRGAVSNAELRDAYFDADIFCLPSRQEGFGIVFLEAMAAGLPIVAARAGAVPEVAPQGKVAILVPTGDVSALSKALTHLLGNPEARARMGAAGIERSRAYDLDVIGPRFLKAALEPDPGTEHG